jgi:hypothetical protein
MSPISPGKDGVHPLLDEWILAMRENAIRK